MSRLTSVNTRKRLLQLLQQLLMDIRGERRVAQQLQSNPLPTEKVVLLATGKAAASMARGAIQVLGERIVDGRIISKDGHCAEWGSALEAATGIRCQEAGHPLPDARSLAAGEALVNWLSGLTERLTGEVTLLVLTSGGSSALVEVLPQTVSLNDLVRLNQWLLGSGLDIVAMNRIRQSVSCIKGGGLLACVPARIALEQLIISDVPGDDPAMIGSGLFVPSAQNETDSQPLPALPDWVQAMQQAAKNTCPQHPAQSSERQVHHRIIASNTLACEQLARQARAAGMAVHLHREPLEGEAARQGQIIAAYLRDQAAAGLHIWGGETTVVLPAQPGRGGRNQHLALAAALTLAGSEGITLLAVGTDGSDGPTDDAGAIVDGDTCRRGEAEGQDARLALQQADAGRFLEAAGDLVNTGVTGTNVMDMVVAYKM